MIIGTICPGSKKHVQWKECLSCNSFNCPSVEERLLMIKELQHESDKTRVRASRIAMGCEASDILIKTMDIYVPMDLMTIFMIGNGTHNEIQRAYRPEQVEVGVEAKIDNFTISGHIDLYVKGDIIDIKTCSTFAGMPKFHHKNQVSIYALLARHHGLKVNKLWIHAVNKVTGERRWYSIPKLTMTWDDILRYARNVTGFLRGENIKPEFKRGSSACKWCWVNKYCEMFYESIYGK
nr:MAG: pd-e/exk nuclease-like protein [Lokiarchaeota virus Ratatoskr Meg22_1012]